MYNIKIFLKCILMLGFTFACCANVVQEPPPSLLAQILKDDALWGKDHPAVLAYIQSWNKIEETKSGIFPLVVVGTTRYKNQDEAKQKVDELSRSLQETPPLPNEDFEEFLRDARSRPAPFQVGTFLDPEDKSTQLQWRDSSLQFLAPDLELTTVEQRFGKPDKVTQEITEADKGHRPLVLTLHHYAEGAIVFVVSDWDAKPNSVNRIFLDVQAVINVVFK